MGERHSEHSDPLIDLISELFHTDHLILISILITVLYVKESRFFSHHHFIKEESKVKKVNDLLQIIELGGSRPPCLQMQYQNANF